jgi:hypothetical protein
MYEKISTYEICWNSQNHVSSIQLKTYKLLSRCFWQRLLRASCTTIHANTFSHKRDSVQCFLSLFFLLGLIINTSHSLDDIFYNIFLSHSANFSICHAWINRSNLNFFCFLVLATKNFIYFFLHQKQQEDIRFSNIWQRKN